MARFSTGMFVAIRAALPRAFGFALLWWVLAEGRMETWGVGLASVLLATLASLRLWPRGENGLSLPGLLGFAGFFLIRSLQGGLQVAIQALRPRMALAPDLLELPLTLPAGLPRVLLANTVSLLPGTLSVHLRGDRLRLHVLDRRLPVAEEVRQTQARIARIWKAGR